MWMSLGKKSHPPRSGIKPATTCLQIMYCTTWSTPPSWLILVRVIHTHCDMIMEPPVYTYPNLMWLEPASREETVHLASLQLLFLSSVASTAPRWLSRRLRQSTPPLNCKTEVGNMGQTELPETSLKHDVLVSSTPLLDRPLKYYNKVWFRFKPLASKNLKRYYLWVTQSQETSLLCWFPNQVLRHVLLEHTYNWT